MNSEKKIRAFVLVTVKSRCVLNLEEERVRGYQPACWPSCYSLNQPLYFLQTEHKTRVDPPSEPNTE